MELIGVDGTRKAHRTSFVMTGSRVRVTQAAPFNLPNEIKDFTAKAKFLLRLHFACQIGFLVQAWHILTVKVVRRRPLLELAQITDARHSMHAEEAMRRVTLEEAKALADQWKAQREDFERMPNADYFRDASPHDLIRMWKTGKNTNGKKLTDREFGCLVERWVQVFDGLPPSNEDHTETGDAVALAKLPDLPPDDTVVRPVEVVRLTGFSKSTINRMVKGGSFPPPLRIGTRARGWLARDLKAWRELLDEQRRRPRQ